MATKPAAKAKILSEGFKPRKGCEGSVNVEQEIVVFNNKGKRMSRPSVAAYQLPHFKASQAKQLIELGYDWKVMSYPEGETLEKHFHNHEAYLEHLQAEAKKAAEAKKKKK